MKRWIPIAALLLATPLLLWWQSSKGSIQPLPEGVSVAVRGHFEGHLTPDGQVIPLYLGVDEQFYLCLQAPARRDTSQWEARLDLGKGDGEEREFLPPEIRMETTLCFRAPSLQEAAVPGQEQFCGLLRDTYDGNIHQLPCQPIRLGNQGQAFWDLNQKVYTLAGSPLDEDLNGWLARMRPLIRQSEEQGFFFLAQHGRLIAVNRLRLQGEEWALEKASTLLGRHAELLQSPAALELAGETALEQAEFDFQSGRLKSAWLDLSRADQAYLKLAHPYRLAVLMRQAEILSRMGSVSEAILRLESGLDQCAQSPSSCQPRMIAYAESLLAWLSLLDPDSDQMALSRAGDLLEKALRQQNALQGQQQWIDPLEPANLLVNLGYQRLQIGRQPDPHLQQALSILNEQPSDLSRVQLLRHWSSLIEGLFSLRIGDSQNALALCSQLTGRQDFKQLASWARSCIGRAQQQLGQLEDSAESFQQAILIHENIAPQEMGRGLPLGPGQRAGDYYRLARVLLDRGDANGAWEQLAALDRLAESERERLRCRERVSQSEAAAHWRRNDQRRRQLLDQLVALDLPASSLRRAQLRPVRQSLMRELQNLSRQWPGCSRAETPAQGSPPDFRAVALEDEILLLHRRQDGKVVLDHRTPMQRQQGRRWLRQLTSRLQKGAVTEEDWRTLLTPLAGALVPHLRDNLSEVTIFSLHGWLQDVPLAALPVPSTPSGWLSDLTIPALRPAGLSRIPRSSDSSGSAPLFVVDPKGDLRGGRQLLSHYSMLFPHARIVTGEDASRRSLGEGLPSASFLHVDAHGLYNAAFGELSSLQMSDGSLTLLELAELPSPSRFVNLSGCHTGRWPVTADSGRYGMAGVFARGGTSWVIASRSDLNDRLAGDFNKAFYDNIASGSTIPQAFQAALEQVRPKHPPSAWASLMLIRGAGQ